MKTKAILIAVLLLIAAALLGAILWGQKAEDGNVTQLQVSTSAEATATAADETTAQQTTAAQETATTATEQTEPSTGSSQTGTQQSTKPSSDGGAQQETQPQVSGGVEEWPSGSTATESTEATTEELAVQTTVPTQATEPEKELTDLTYSQYIALSPEDQARFMNAFDSMDAYLSWYKEAKAAYEEDREVITGSGNINIGDYIGN